jgi:hypothetical protein
VAGRVRPAQLGISDWSQPVDPQAVAQALVIDAAGQAAIAPAAVTAYLKTRRVAVHLVGADGQWHRMAADDLRDPAVRARNLTAGGQLRAFVSHEILADIRRQAAIAAQAEAALESGPAEVGETVVWSLPGAAAAARSGAPQAARAAPAILSAVPEVAPLIAPALAELAVPLLVGQHLAEAGRVRVAGQPPPPLKAEETTDQPQAPPVVGERPSNPPVSLPTDQELPKGELVPRPKDAAPPATETTESAPESSSSLTTQPAAPQPPLAGGPEKKPPIDPKKIVPPAAATTVGTGAGLLAHELSSDEMKPVPIVITPTGDVDPASDALAKEIGGVASVRIDGYGNREFDAVSDRYIAQTTDSESAVNRPHNFLTISRRAQIRETLKAAKETGRVALFQFTNGAPAQEVMDFITRNAERVGAKFEIVVK